MKISLFVMLMVVGQVFAVPRSEKIKFPKKLICQFEGREKKEPQVLYTRLSKFTSLAELPSIEKPKVLWSSEKGGKPEKDELAMKWEGDYFRSSIDEANFRYDLWTCDTEDRFYLFDTQDLLAPDLTTKVHRVTGKVDINIREDEEHKSVVCVAIY